MASLRALSRWRGRLPFILATIALALAVPARAEVLVVTTTPDLKSIAEAVSGDAVRVESLVPAGADAEAFEPRPSHVALLQKAALLVRIGLGYDDWVDRLVLQSGNAGLRRGGEASLDLSTGIALLEVQGRSLKSTSGHAHGAANPHYWLDPVTAEFMSAAIAEALVRIRPEQKDAITSAQDRFVADLRNRLQRWTRRLEPYRGAPLVSYHNSWPYFARRFHLDIVDVIEPKEGVPPGAARLLALVSTMRARNVRVIVQEPFEPAEASRSLADRTGARVVVLAPAVGSTPAAGDYLALFETNVDLLAKALAERR